MALDLIGLFVLFAFAALGAWRGGVSSGAGLIGLVLGYGAAIVAATRLGPVIGHQLAISSLVAGLVAGSVAFLLTWCLVALGAWWLKRRLEEERAGGPPGAADRLVGAGFGALRGALVLVLLAWLASWVDAARDAGVEGFAGVPQTENSKVAAFSASAVESAVEVALSRAGTGSKVAARLAARPTVSLDALQGLIENPRLQDVQRDRHFWTLVENGASESALNRGTFYKIVHDPELRQRFSTLGLVSQAAADDPQAFRDEVRHVLDEIGPRIKGLKNDPEIQELARDPEVLALLEQGDTLGLMRHAGIRRVASRIAEGLEPESDARES